MHFKAIYFNNIGINLLRIETNVLTKDILK